MRYILVPIGVAYFWKATIWVANMVRVLVQQGGLTYSINILVCHLINIMLPTRRVSCSLLSGQSSKQISLLAALMFRSFSLWGISFAHWTYGVYHSHGGTQRWMVYNQGNSNLYSNWLYWHMSPVGDLERLLFFPCIGKNSPDWLSYVSEGLKPPTRLTMWALQLISAFTIPSNEVVLTDKTPKVI